MKNARKEILKIMSINGALDTKIEGEFVSIVYTTISFSFALIPPTFFLITLTKIKYLILFILHSLANLDQNFYKYLRYYMLETRITGQAPD